MSVEEILHEIGKRGEWRVTIRPLKFEEQRLKFKDCKSLIEQCQVILRGWYYPHYHNPGEAYGGIGFGDDFVQCITDHRHFKEIWRMHQTGLFFHRFACFEDWWPETADRNVLEIYSTLYRVTEIFQFASTLAMKNIFDDQLKISIELVRMKNRTLIMLNQGNTITTIRIFGR